MLTAVFESLNVAVLSSRRAPGLAAMLHHPQRDRLFEIACVVTTDEEFADGTLVEDCGVPLLKHPIREYHLKRHARLQDMNVRREYDAATAAALRKLGVNTVILLGYLYVVTDPMLDAFPQAIFNIHDSDLSLQRPDGRRKYVGLHSTRDAIVAGETSTRSSVHLVNEEIDAGPLLMRSDPYPVAPFAHEAVAAGAVDVLKAYAYAHREWMMRSSWGTLLVRTLEDLASGALNEVMAVPAS